MLISTTPSFGDKVICWYTCFTMCFFYTCPMTIIFNSVELLKFLLIMEQPNGENCQGTEKPVDKFLYSNKCINSYDPKFSDRQFWSNSVDPDQSDQCLHCLQFSLHILDVLLCGKTTFFKLYRAYRKFPKYSDTQKIVVITLKFELCGSTIE